MEQNKNHDFMACPGNICVTDPENTFTNWYPDEAICVYKPRPKWLKRMIKIQKLFLDGKIRDDRYFMLKDLEKIRLVRKPRGILMDSQRDRQRAESIAKLALKAPLNMPITKVARRKLMVDTSFQKGA